MKYDELRKLAIRATVGPYEVDYHANRYHIIRAGRFGEGIGQTFTDEDAAYIAAASPDVILALLDERERLLKELAGFKRATVTTAGRLVAHTEGVES